MNGPPASATPKPGRTPEQEPGFSYLPRFITTEEATALIAFFGSLHPQWEDRHATAGASRRGANARLTRPVYWLGAWQFAALGYYSEPDHVLDKCVRAEPFPEVMKRILERLGPSLVGHDGSQLPNTCLINFYGRFPKEGLQPPVDMARLRMHRDGEPGPVVMFSIGQPAQFEFVEPDATEPHHSQWIRNRSVVVLSGSTYKDRLYHRVTRVRYGQEPALSAQLDSFDVRRISVSFRHVPENRIVDLIELGPEAQAIARPYVTKLAVASPHFARQLNPAP